MNLNNYTAEQFNELPKWAQENLIELENRAMKKAAVPQPEQSMENFHCRPDSEEPATASETEIAREAVAEIWNKPDFAPVRNKVYTEREWHFLCDEIVVAALTRHSAALQARCDELRAIAVEKDRLWSEACNARNSMQKQLRASQARETALQADAAAMRKGLQEVLNYVLECPICDQEWEKAGHAANCEIGKALSTIAGTVLLTELEELRKKIAYVEKMGLQFGMMKTSDKPEPYLAHTWDENSDHERMFREWTHSIGWEEALASNDKEIASLREDKERLDWIRDSCKVIYWPPPDYYPIEHAPLAGKDSWQMILDYSTNQEKNIANKT